MIEFNESRKCWVGENEMFIPCKTSEFSNGNGNQNAIVHLVKKTKYAKDDKLISVFGEEYALKRFLLGTEKTWIKHSEKYKDTLYWCQISTTDKPLIKEQQTLF